MENEPVVHVGSKSKSLRDLRHWPMRKLVVAIIVVLVVAALGYVLVSKLTGSNVKDSAKTEKVLMIADLENPDVELTSATSDASVENLTTGLKGEIDKQSATKKNPIETVKELAVVLSNTTNEKRQDQLTSFLEDFLANHEDELWLENEYDMPDQARVNYWKAELYAYLIHNFQSMMESKFTGADGKPVDTTKQQLKYIDLYLALANDPVSHPPIPEEDKAIFPGYVYREAASFSQLKNSLTSGGLAQ